MKNYLQLINQFFEIQQKVKDENIKKNIDRIINIFKEEGYTFIDPSHEKYLESRTDCEASIVGNWTQNMYISKTIKPIIYFLENDKMQLVQKAIVIVENKS
jgi:deoxycytidine triphosphate deaminase